MAQRCKLCGSGVPDNLTNCHICNAPLGDETVPDLTKAGSSVMEEAAAMKGIVPGLQANMKDPLSDRPAGGSGEMRVALTGDVFEVPVQRPVAAPTPGAAPGAPPRPGAPGAAAGKGKKRNTYDEDGVLSKPSTASTVVFVVVAILMVVGGAFGWWKYNNRTNPKDQAVLIAKQLWKEQDFKALYDNLAQNEEDAKKFKNAEDFAKEQTSKMMSNPASGQIAQMKALMGDFTAGEPKVDGNTAVVPLTVKLGPTEMKGSAKLVKQAGIWKLDMTNKSDQENGITALNVLDTRLAGLLAGGGMQGR